MEISQAYRIFNVSVFDEKEIHNKYRQLVSIWHPDKKPNGSEEKFKEVVEAYNLLINSNKKECDKEHIYFPKRGSDISVVKEIFLKDICIKKTIDIDYYRKKICESCNGSGGLREECDFCCGGKSKEYFIEGCKNCNSFGYVIYKKNRCDKCKGVGSVSELEKIKIKSILGICDGFKYKIPYMGNCGKDGASSGNLTIKFKIINHDNFVRDGYNIIHDVNVSIDDLLDKKYIYIRDIYNKKIRINLTDSITVVEKSGIPNFEDNSVIGYMVVKKNMLIPDKFSSKEIEAIKNRR